MKLVLLLTLLFCGSMAAQGTGFWIFNDTTEDVEEVHLYYPGFSSGNVLVQPLGDGVVYQYPVMILAGPLEVWIHTGGEWVWLSVHIPVGVTQVVYALVSDFIPRPTGPTIPSTSSTPKKKEDDGCHVSPSGGLSILVLLILILFGVRVVRS